MIVMMASRSRSQAVALTCPRAAGMLLPAWPRLVPAFVGNNTGQPCGLKAIDACRLD